MLIRARAVFGGLALSFALAGCGGGGSSGSGGVNPPPGPGPGSVTITPSSMTFGGPGAASQTFTVSSTVTGVSAPTIDPLGCAPVVNITTNSSTLPATYTVAPTGNGTCTVVANVGHQSASIGIQVGSGSGPGLIGSGGTITLTIGGSPGTFTASASSGNIVPDTTACNGIAQISGAGGPSPQTFSITPLAAGSCVFTVVDGNSSVAANIVVNSPGGGAAVFVTPTSMTFATRGSAAQSGTITNSGQVGNVSINEDSCTGTPSGPKIAFLTITGVPPGQPVTLPANFTITPYGPSFGSGTCQIVFTPATGASATLTVTVNP
jgi:hypothetical protein